MLILYLIYSVYFIYFNFSLRQSELGDVLAAFRGVLPKAFFGGPLATFVEVFLVEFAAHVVEAHDVRLVEGDADLRAVGTPRQVPRERAVFMAVAVVLD